MSSQEIFLIIIAVVFILLIIPNLYQLAKADRRPDYTPPPIEYLKEGDKIIVKTTGETGVIRSVIHNERPEYGDFNTYYVALDKSRSSQSMYHSIYGGWQAVSFKRSEIDTPVNIRKEKIQNIVYDR